jgi:hypothetical protein
MPDALKLSHGDRTARQLVERIDELFSVDAEARNAGMDHAARHVLREEGSGPMLELLKKRNGSFTRPFPLPDNLL